MITQMPTSDTYSPATAWTIRYDYARSKRSEHMPDGMLGSGKEKRHVQVSHRFTPLSNLCRLVLVDAVGLSCVILLTYMMAEQARVLQASLIGSLTLCLILLALLYTY